MNSEPVSSLLQAFGGLSGHEFNEETRPKVVSALHQQRVSYLNSVILVSQKQTQAVEWTCPAGSCDG